MDLQTYRGRSIKQAALIRILLYATVVMTPLVVATLFGRPSPLGFLFELGRSCALVAFPIVCMQFILSARLKWVEHPFGLDVLYLFHRAMAIFAMSLLLLHPLLLAAGGPGSALLLELDMPWYIWAGRAGLLLLLIHGAVSLFRLTLRLEFERWRFLHNLFAAVILVFVFVHSWNAGADLDLLPMRILWVGLFLAAALAFVYHRSPRLLRQRKLRRHAYRVEEVRQETHNTWTLKLRPPDDEPCYDYLPGQFQFLTLQRGNHLPVEEHPFTISSAPTEQGYVTSTIKASGDFTATIGETKPGDSAVVQAPFGRFSYLLHPEEKDLVLIAGGVGITPLMSMLRHMRHTQAHLEVLLIYANKAEQDIVFRKELAELEGGESPRLKVVHVLSRAGENWSGEVGHVDAEKIQRLCGEKLVGKAFYVCGPPAMIQAVIKSLQKLGVPEDRIHFERFSL